MHVHKLRGAQDSGLIPAGRYFARLSRNLAAPNARTAKRDSTLAAGYSDLETLYRRRSAARLM